MNKIFSVILCVICLTFVSCSDIFTNVEAQPVYSYTYYYEGTCYPVKYNNAYPYYYFNYRWIPIPRDRYVHIRHNHHKPSNSYHQYRPNNRYHNH